MEINGLIPTPPATKITFFTCLISDWDSVGGGHVKEPPIRIWRVEFRMVGIGCQRWAAGGLVDFWIASSRYGGDDDGVEGGRARARLGVDVIVKPPGLGRLGMWTSSHWPGRNYCLLDLSVDT